MTKEIDIYKDINVKNSYFVLRDNLRFILNQSLSSPLEFDIMSSELSAQSFRLFMRLNVIKVSNDV